ncbi:hypothetical protein [Melittangium boletus]|uniref:Lipoprotein n=1 Tax=Melittangium boletus DSM 14713 TaxID=1294270 RepID=A0A250IKV6_9BACT|nr:hypothetical protein [Melittangium boletus]ATB32395.1 hypothetical protein MEBOL_005873 [Melittangium boletus DSM 14713]
MMSRLAITSLLAAAAAGCAGQQQAQTGGAPISKEERLRITNQSPFDVAVCKTQAPALSQPANQGILVGALLASRPQVMECLVDPKSRGTAETTRLVVKTTVNEQGGSHVISGENLTPEGIACVQKLVDTRVPLTPLAKGAAPVESESTFVHEAGNSPSVRFGLNPGSDFSGNVRLAQAQWCDCYAGYETKAPPTLRANVDLKKASATAADITFDSVGTPEGDQLAACLKGKMMAVPVKLEVDELKFPYRFVHFNSHATEPAADLTPELRLLQLDLVRNQRSADAAIAFGNRANAAEAYDAIVAKYQKTKDWKLIDELKSKCRTLVDSAQAWVNSIESQRQVDQSTVDLARELKAKDAAWGDLEAKTQEIIAVTQQDLDTAKQRLAADQGACPKETTEAAPKKKK